MRRLAITALGVTLALFVAIPGATSPLSGPTLALAKCQPHRTDDGVDYRDGWIRSPGASYVGGVYSLIYNYSPWVQPNSEVSAWSMLNLGQSWWAQVGWWEYPYGNRKTFVQWTYTGGLWTTKFYNPQPVGSVTYYTTLYDNSTNILTFEVAGSPIDTETSSFVPTNAQIMGEIHTLADQMPGGYQLNEVLGDSNIWYNGSWHAFSGTVSNSNTFWFGNQVNSSTYDYIWDTTCST